jgi:site-specific DNA recombinase
MSEQKTRKVAVYIRVSTSEKKLEGFSPDAQRKRLLAHIKENKTLNLETRSEWIFEDTSTGGDLNREGYKAMMKLVEKGEVDAVLVWRIDRLSRNLKHLIASFEKLQKHDVSFISLQENIDFKGPIGKLIFQIFGAIAEFERELIKGRSYMGRFASAEMGNFTRSAIPYGYDVIKKKTKGKRLKIIPEEKEWVRQMFHWYVYDGLGDLAISKKLNELNVPLGKHNQAKKRFEWTSDKINAMLQEPLYTGDYVAIDKDELGKDLDPDDYVVVKVPSCIGDFIFLQAQEIRKGRTAKDNRDYLLTGRLWDMSVESPRSFVGAKRNKGGFSYRRKKFTRDSIEYPNFEIPAKPLDDYVWGKIMEALEKPEVFIKNYFARNQVNKKDIENLEEQLPILEEENINLEIKLQRADDKLTDGKISDESHERITRKANRKIEQNSKQIQEIRDELGRLASIDIEARKLKDASSQIDFKLDALTAPQKKIICMLFIERIEIYSEEKTISTGKKLKIEKDVWTEVKFKFNLNKFPKIKQGVEPEKPVQDNAESELKTEDQDTGAAFGT